MTLHIELGDSYGDGSQQPSAETMAAAAFRGIRGEYYVPMIQWVKEYPGQVTNGRIGRPVIRFCPLSWAGSQREKEVLALLPGQQKESA